VEANSTGGQGSRRAVAPSGDDAFTGVASTTTAANLVAVRTFWLVRIFLLSTFSLSVHANS
jgi:hypothetical protein